MLFFSETLAMISQTGEPQGELTIEVQSGKHEDNMGAMSQCALVHAFTHGFVDKILCGNSLLGRVPAAEQPPSPPTAQPSYPTPTPSPSPGLCLVPTLELQRGTRMRHRGCEGGGGDSGQEHQFCLLFCCGHTIPGSSSGATTLPFCNLQHCLPHWHCSPPPTQAISRGTWRS